MEIVLGKEPSNVDEFHNPTATQSPDTSLNVAVAVETPLEGADHVKAA
jgi:hypothetical protein